MKTYYKVVIQKPDGLLVSTSEIHNNPLKVCYKTNEWNYPVSGKLFVYGSLISARSMVRNNNGWGIKYKIFKCECETPIRPKFNSILDLKNIYTNDASSMIKRFWKTAFNSIDPYLCCWEIPSDTYICDAVKLKDEL
jgi:hypothetical protein